MIELEKYFNINGEGYSIRCKAYYNKDLRSIGKAVICCHGFGGHKDGKAMLHFAEKALSKTKDLAVICFDWPCHGEDARKKLTLEGCDTYLSAVTEYCRTTWNTDLIYLYATSFGGYITLKYIHEHGKPFRKIVLRCPAIDMYGSFVHHILTPDLQAKLQAGKPVLAGFDRKVEITRDFLEEVHSCDLTQMDFLDYADDILIIQGTKDEIISFETVRDFADNNVIELIAAEKADHRFQDPQIMANAIAQTLEFMQIGK